jgi:ankyrin repeat protein
MMREAAVDSTNSNGATPLHLACNSQYLSDFVLPLLARGAPVSAADNAGCTPLFYASQKGCLEAVKELLTWGAKADAASNDGRTPLAVAEAGGHLDVANHLRAHLLALP